MTKTRKPVREGVAFLIESELEKAELVLAAQAIPEKLQNMAEQVAKIEADDVMPLLDQMRNLLGAPLADRFSDAVTQHTRQLLDSLKDAKEAISTQIANLEKAASGEAVSDFADDLASDQDGAPEMPPAPPVASDAADDDADEEQDAGMDDMPDFGAAGRPRKESVSFAGAKALMESTNPDALILRTLRRAMAGRTLREAAIRTARYFMIDASDVLTVVKEAKAKLREFGLDKDRMEQQNADLYHIVRNGKVAARLTRTDANKWGVHFRGGELGREYSTPNDAFRAFARHQDGDGRVPTRVRESEGEDHKLVRIDADSYRVEKDGKQMAFVIRLEDGKWSVHRKPEDGRKLVKRTFDTAKEAFRAYVHEDKLGRDEDHRVAESRRRLRVRESEGEDHKLVRIDADSYRVEKDGKQMAFVMKTEDGKWTVHRKAEDGRKIIKDEFNTAKEAFRAYVHHDKDARDEDRLREAEAPLKLVRVDKDVYRFERDGKIIAFAMALSNGKWAVHREMEDGKRLLGRLFDSPKTAFAAYKRDVKDGEDALHEFEMRPVPKAKRGMFDGWSEAELRAELKKVKHEMAAREKTGPVPHDLRSRFSELTFALRAKDGWGKIDEFEMRPVPKAKRGMWDGWSEGELRNELKTVKREMKAHEDKGERVPHALRTKFSEITFALRAKTGWGKVEEAMPVKPLTPADKRAQIQEPNEGDLERSGSPETTPNWNGPKDKGYNMNRTSRRPNGEPPFTGADSIQRAPNPKDPQYNESAARPVRRRVGKKG